MATDEELEAIKETLHREFENHQLACWSPPFVVPGTGLVVELSFYDKQTYQGPRAFLLLSEDETFDVGEMTEKLGVVMSDIAVDPESTMSASLAEVFNLPELPITVEEYPARDEDIERRSTALTTSFSRFDGAAKRFKQMMGLRLPKHVAVWHALCESLTPLESRGADYLGRGRAGYMFLFDENGLEREPRDGIDPRVEYRFRADPPEFVTIGSGDSDGLHFGLWYDADDELPAFVVSNYARDSAETWRRGRTMIETLWEEFQDRERDQQMYGGEEFPASVAAFGAAIQWFLEADRDAASELAGNPYGDIERNEVTGGLGPALSDADGDRRGEWDQLTKRYDLFRNDVDATLALVEIAKAELAEGKPAFALVLGRELHWLDKEGLREPAKELLVLAYHALGRPALAGIVEAHYTHRDLGSVGVF